MAQFCHDQYDHPLLWCDEKRRAEERKIAQDSLAIVRQHRENQESRKVHDLREFRDLTDKHFPWGRPGGGAPNEQIRRGKLEGLFPEPRGGFRKGSQSVNKRGRRGGGGAPIRGCCGRLITTLCDDPSISFNDGGRNRVDNDLRYKKSPKEKLNYKMELDKCIADRDEVRRNGTMNMKQDPWGKMGPGGAPWRNPSQVGHSFMKSMGWTDKTLMKTLDEDMCRGGPPDEYDESPYKKFNRPVADTNPPMLPSQCCASCFCDCKAKYGPRPPIDHHPEPQPPLIHRECRKENLPQDISQNASANHKKKCKHSKTRTCMISGGVELVPLLARRRAMQRPISLSTTDVTKPSDKNKWQECGGIQLLDDLCRQMSQKERRKEMTQDVEKESAILHFETLDNFWGRPGNGAPKTMKYKQNLNDLLYRPRA